MKKYLFDKGKGYAAKWDETGEVLYVRGLINAMLGVEAIRIASDWITADDSIIAPMVKEAAAKYAAEKKLTPGCLVTN